MVSFKHVLENPLKYGELQYSFIIKKKKKKKKKKKAIQKDEEKVKENVETWRNVNISLNSK